MAKQKNTIVESSFANSTPYLTRSEIKASTLSNLYKTDVINRCYIKSALITKTGQWNPATGSGSGPASPGKAPKTSLRRCNIATSTISNTSLRMSKVRESTLSNICSGHRVEALNSTLDNVSSLRRVTVSNTTINNQSALSRCQAKDSLVSASTVSRASIENSQVVRSQVRNSNLQDCEVSDCVIMNTDFRGKVLRNEVWRNGILVGSCGTGGEEVTAKEKKLETPVKSVTDQRPEMPVPEIYEKPEKQGNPEKSEKWMAELEELEYETAESSDWWGSESDDDDEEDEENEKPQEKKDPPPPYTNLALP